ncbi:MAG: MarR family transcriptional regulator [Planctomycetales bacterium]|nr:MarR family transcriptional regulator [Planctomycetales bacterium]
MAATQPTASTESVALNYDFEASIGYWIVLTSQAFQKALTDELQPHGLTYRQSQVLGWLVIDGELSQVELANRMMIEPATLVGVLDRMERDSLIRRCSSTGDRRRKVIRLTPQSSGVWEKVVQCAKRIRQQATQGLSDRQLAALIKSLRIVLNNLRHYQSSQVESG